MRFEKVNFGRWKWVYANFLKKIVTSEAVLDQLEYIYSKLQKYVLRQKPYGHTTSAISQKRETWLYPLHGWVPVARWSKTDDDVKKFPQKSRHRFFPDSKLQNKGEERK